MTRNLGWIALGGLSIGITSLSLAFALDGRRLPDWPGILALGSSCNDGGAKAGAGARERRLAWDGGDSIDLALPGTVHWRGGDGSDLVVRGSPDLVANIEVRHGRLVLNCHDYGRARDVEIILPGRVFRRIGLAGSSKLVMENVNQPELTLSISGSGSVRAQGTVDRTTVNIAGSGDARLAGLAMKELTAKISGSGKVEAAPKDSADVTISGSGDVRLASRPATLRSKVSGSGRVSQASE
jgi:hypothetical protein